MRRTVRVNYPDGYIAEFYVPEDDRIFKLESILTYYSAYVAYSRSKYRHMPLFAYRVVEISQDKKDVWLEEMRIPGME